MSEASPDQALARLWAAFFGELRRLGYVEGKNLVVERYSGEGRVERFRDLASNVVRRNPTTKPSGDYPGTATEEILAAHLSERQLKRWIIDLDRR